MKQVRRAQQESAEAAAFVWEQCRAPLLRVIRAHLHFPLRRLFDAEDFLDEPLTRLCRGPLPEDALKSPEQLWGYLRAIVGHAVDREQRKYLHAERRSLAKDVPLGEVADDALGRDEPPGASAEVDELSASVLNKLPASKRLIAELLFQGYSVSEIAEALDVKQREVSEVRRWLGQQLGRTIVWDDCFRLINDDHAVTPVSATALSRCSPRQRQVQRQDNERHEQQNPRKILHAAFTARRLLPLAPFAGRAGGQVRFIAGQGVGRKPVVRVAGAERLTRCNVTAGSSKNPRT